MSFSILVMILSTEDVGKIEMENPERICAVCTRVRIVLGQECFKGVLLYLKCSASLDVLSISGD